MRFLDCSVEYVVEEQQLNEVNISTHFVSKMIFRISILHNSKIELKQ